MAALKRRDVLMRLQRDSSTNPDVRWLLAAFAEDCNDLRNSIVQLASLINTQTDIIAGQDALMEAIIHTIGPDKVHRQAKIIMDRAMSTTELKGQKAGISVASEPVDDGA